MPKSKEDYMAKHKAKLTHNKQPGNAVQGKPGKGGNAAAGGGQNAKKQ